MGGNALKNTFTRRYDKGEYFSIFPKISRTFIDFYGVQSLSLIEAYSKKESFGDMDILYTTYDDKPLGVDEFVEKFKPQEIVRNSNVISMAYEELQVDFIHVENDIAEYAQSYFSYNDCGNLVGKLARRFGLKHGHNGLVLPLRDGNNMFGEVTLTLDHNRTLEFLELDVEQFNGGFETIEQIFEFIAASPHYNPDDYKLENVSHAGRVRDKKRDTYQKFLVFGENWKGERIPKEVDKTIYLERIFDAFPEAYPEYKQKMFDLATQKFIKNKFNGDLVGEWTGLKEKELGAFMKILRSDFFFRPENIVYLTEEQLKSRVVANSALLKHIKENPSTDRLDGNHKFTIKEMKFSMNNLY